MSEDTGNPQVVLLAMSTARKSPHSMERAVDLARERALGLVAIFALEEEVLEDVVEKLSEEGWIGERPSQGFYDSAISQREELGLSKLAQVERLADNAGVVFRSEIIRGSFEGAVRQAIDTLQPPVVVMTRRKRSDLSRRFFGSPAAKLVKHLPVEVILVDEE